MKCRTLGLRIHQTRHGIFNKEYFLILGWGCAAYLGTNVKIGLNQAVNKTGRMLRIWESHWAYRCPVSITRLARYCERISPSSYDSVRMVVLISVCLTTVVAIDLCKRNKILIRARCLGLRLIFTYAISHQ